MRRHDIDALRVVIFGLLIFYHVGMFFVPWDYHLNNSPTYEWLKYPMIFLNRWRLPLLFVLSGMGTYFNISKRNGAGFAKERFVRLFIPLVIGILFIVPPQIYFEKIDAGLLSGNYFEFWPLNAFTGVYPEGNFSWHHLWFLPYLLLFSLILIPVFLYLKNHTQSWIIQKLKILSTKKFGLFVFTIPLIIWQNILYPRFPPTHALFDDWYNIVNYGTLFLYGFLLMSLKDALWENVIKNRRLYLITGFVAFAIMMYIEFVSSPFPYRKLAFCSNWAIDEWAWILTLIGYSATYLNKPSRTLSYTNEAVYPFYILHQTVLIALCYYLKNVEINFFAKFSILAIGTFGISWLIYEFGIRRFKWIRPLFGMKIK